MADGNKGFLDFSFLNVGSPASAPPPGATGGLRSLLDFCFYPTGSASSVTPPPPGVSAGTPLLFDMQQPGLMEMQSFFPAWAMCNPVRQVREYLDVECGDLSSDISVGGFIDNQEGLIHCCM